MDVILLTPKNRPHPRICSVPDLGKNLRHGVDLGTRYCFGTIANTVCDALDVKACLAGCSVWNEIKA